MDLFNGAWRSFYNVLVVSRPLSTYLVDLFNGLILWTYLVDI